MNSALPELKKTILLVEDEYLIAMMECRDLECEGYNVIHAGSGEEAVSVMRENGSGIDLILMDIDLGLGMDGTDAARLILEMVEVPVIFLSSHTEKEVVNKTEEITSYGYVVKNTGITVLAASIRMAFRLFAANRKISTKNNEILQASAKLMELNEELLKSRNSIAESEERYKGIFESFVDIYYRVDSSGIITELSPSAMDLSGWKREELIGMPVSAIYQDPAEREDFLRRIEDEGRVNGFEIYLTRKDGRSIPVSVHARQSFNRYGMPDGVEGSLRDISEKKHIEYILHQTVEKYRVLIDNSDDMIWTLDASGLLTYVSPSWEKLLGYKPEYIIGKDYRQFIHADDEALCTMLIQEGISSGERVKSPPFRVLRSDGSYRWYQANGIALFDRDGNFHSCVGISRDVHEWKISGERLEAERAAADTAFRAKSDFLSRKSREIMVPLNGVIGFTGLLCGTALDAEQRQFAENACLAARSLPGIVNDLIDFFSVESGMAGAGVSVTDMRLVLEQNAELDGNMATSRGSEPVYPEGCTEAGRTGRMLNAEPVPVIDGMFRIIVAEDNEINLTLERAFIKKVVPAAEIIAAGDGLETMRSWTCDGADIIFVDIQMPLMDGYGVISEIRRIEKNSGGYTPVIALTAGAVSGESEKCLAAGMDDYMVKPVTFRKIASLLVKYLGTGRHGGARHSAAGYNAARFNIDELRRRLGGDEALLKSMINLSIKYFGGYVQDLLDSLSGNDSLRTSRLLHLVKGAALNACFDRLAAIVGDFEGRVPCDEGKTLELVSIIEQEYQYLREEIFASGLVSKGLENC